MWENGLLGGLGRGASLIVLILAAHSVLTVGCKQERLAAARVSGTGPISAPENVVIDPSAPGKTHKVGRLTVTDDTLSELRAALQEFLRLDGGATAHGVILLNPTQDRLNDLGSNEDMFSCTPGKYHACLILGNMNGDALAAKVKPWTSIEKATPIVDPKQVTVIADDPVTLSADYLDLFHPMLDMTTFKKAPESTEEVPVYEADRENGIAQLLWLAPLNTYSSWDIPPHFLQEGVQIDNWEVPIEIVPWLSVGGAKVGAEELVGVWGQIRIRFPEGFVRYNQCRCGIPDQDTIPPQWCEEACKEAHDCPWINIRTKLVDARARFGFVPSIKSGCDPRLGADPSYSVSGDPRIGWMRNIFGGQEYRQNCLEVKFAMAGDTGFFDPAEGFTEVDGANENTVRVEAGPWDSCSYTAWLGCASGIVDCNALATGGATVEFGRRINDAVAMIANANSSAGSGANLSLAGLFEYTSANGTPYVSPDEYAGDRFELLELANDPVMASKFREHVVKHGLPSSLSFMAHAWFAGAFGPTGPAASTRPWQQYPVYKVERSCPDDGRWDSDRWHACVRCKPGWKWLIPDEPTNFECKDTATGLIEDAYKTHSQIDMLYLADPDDDNLVAPADNCPFVNNPAQENNDSDSLGNYCDNCPFKANEDQTDTDKDGIGDACDSCDNEQKDLDGDGVSDACELPIYCPCDPTPAGMGDWDGICDRCDASLGGPGSFCEGYCQGKKTGVGLDNCPGAHNPYQQNCNQAWEEARGMAILGDACDPVPCPKFDTTFANVLSQKTWFAFKDGKNVQFFESEIGLSTIDVGPIGSRPAPDKLTAPATNADQVLASEKAVSVPSTWYRYCANISGSTNAVDCSDPGLLNESYLVETGWNRTNETAYLPWHMISIVENGLLTNSNNPSDGTHSFFTTNKWSRTWDWNYDFAYWTGAWGNGLLAIPSKGGVQGSDGAGALWVHADTEAGMSVDIGTGKHGWADGSTTNSHSLANRTREETLVVHSKSMKGSTGWDGIKPYFSMQVCPLCPVEELPDIREYGTLHPGPLVFPLNRASQQEAQTLVKAMIGDTGFIGVLEHDGSISPVDDRIGTHLMESLNSVDNLWIGQAEPSPYVGGTNRPIAVALKVDGSAFVETVTLGKNSLYGSRDIVLQRAMGAVAVNEGAVEEAASSGHPAPRTEFQAVYSRSLGTVFVIGGTDLASNAAAGDVWALDVQTRQWQRLSLGDYAPGKVLAATYSYQDRKLWVLDEAVVGTVVTARLTSIDPLSGTAQPVASWKRQHSLDRHWMACDRDGGVLLAASSGSANRYVLIRIGTAGATPTVQGVRHGGRRLIGAPVIDLDGYSLLLDGMGKKKEPEIERMTSIDWKPGKWTDIGGVL